MLYALFLLIFALNFIVINAVCDSSNCNSCPESSEASLCWNLVKERDNECGFLENTNFDNRFSFGRSDGNRCYCCPKQYYNNTKTAQSCIINGKKLEIFDSFRCFLANLSFFLYQIKFGYICIFLLFLISTISIFGKISHCYRWFILNQAIWDILISYFYICDNSTSFYFFSPKPSCLFLSNSSILPTFLQAFRYSSYSALFLLSFSRFLCLYFMDFYQKLTKGRRIFYFIILFNFVMHFVHLDVIFWNLLLERDWYLKVQCLIYQRANNIISKTDICYSKDISDFLWNLCYTFYRIFTALYYLQPILCLFLSFLATMFLIIRLIRQAKFQAKSNHRLFLCSVRCTVVIFLHTLINFFVFLLEFTTYFQTILQNIFGIPVLTSWWPAGEECKGCIDFKLPLIFGGEWGLTSGQIFQVVMQIRIFFESLIILLLMSGYRESIVEFIKICYLALKNPLKYYEKCLNYVFATEVVSFNNNSDTNLFVHFSNMFRRFSN